MLSQLGIKMALCFFFDKKLIVKLDIWEYCECPKVHSSFYIILVHLL